MRKLSENAIENIANGIVDLILSRGKSLYVPKVGGGNNEKDSLKDRLKIEVIRLKDEGRNTNVQELVENIILGYLKKKKMPNYTILTVPYPTIYSSS